MTRSYATLNWVCPLHHSHNDITLLLITSNVHDYETNHPLINKLVKRHTRTLCLSRYHTCTNVLVNTIIAWYINIYHKHKDINNNHFIIASRAYLLQSPTCTRVNNLVYICKDITPWPSGALSCFAHGRGFSQRIWHAQKRMYFVIHLRLNASLISKWVGIKYVWSSGGTLIPRSEICH